MLQNELSFFILQKIRWQSYFRIAVLIFCLSLSKFTHATHIVGGELERKHIGGSLYEVSLILYFDQVNGNPNAQDPSAVVGVFAKSNDAFITQIVLPIASQSPVFYTNPLCAIPQLSTRRLVYRALQSFPASTFNDTSGYYMVWDRCCRNSGITNIIQPGATGQLFYMEFPPSVVDQSLFINSSPSLFPPVSDYACVNQLFQFNIAGTDLDGDSLSYELTTPLAGFGGIGNAVPPLQPGPYPQVFFQPGISVNNMIPGAPPFQVSTSGLISFRPGQSGLYVFAIKCSEFRNGIKIGEVRREFQMIVIPCLVNNAPTLASQDFSNPNFETDTLYATDSIRCFNVKLTDPDPNTSLNVRITDLNSTSVQVSLLASSFVLNTGPQIDTVDFQFCITGCIPSFDTVQFALISEDEGCPFQLADTIKIVLITGQLGNSAPQITADVAEGPINLSINTFLGINSRVTDPDGDSVFLSLFSPDLPLASTGISIIPSSGRAPFDAFVSWRPDCRFYQRDSLRLYYIWKEQSCDERTDTLFYVIRLDYDNNAPKLGLRDQTGDDTVLTAIIDQPFEQLIYLTDPEFDPLSLTWQRRLGQFPGNFSIDRLSGTDSTFARIRWTPRCDDEFQAPLVINFNGRESSCENLNIMQDYYFYVEDQPITDLQPNMISPNGDGKNDRFSIDYLPAQCEFEEINILNRWGRVVFSSTDDTFQWDGGGEPDGTYYYFARYKNKTLKGFVMMIR